MPDVPRAIGLLVLYLVVGGVAGGVLAALGDEFAAGLIAGTPLGPAHPMTPVYWTGIGALVVAAVHQGATDGGVGR